MPEQPIAITRADLEAIATRMVLYHKLAKASLRDARDSIERARYEGNAQAFLTILNELGVKHE